MTKTVVSAAPTSTTNITGFFATFLGLSLTNDSLVARFTISGSNSGRARTPLEMSAVASCSLISGLRSTGGAVTVDISSSLFAHDIKTIFHSAFGSARRSDPARAPGNK